MTTADFAQFAASHALLLLGAAIALLALFGAAIVGIVHLAHRYADGLWSLIDAIVPGDLVRARAYLLVHLALGFVVAAAAGAFVFIAEAMLGRTELVAFDLAFGEALRTDVHPVWRTFFWWFTWLGSYPVVATIVAAASWRLVSRGRKLLALMWVISQTGGAVLNVALKMTFGRPRPAGADPLLFDTNLSFPSGHALTAVVLSGVGAYILMQTIRSWRARVLLVAGALLWSLPMGFSRVYLGVHYFSDVIAGFLIGAAWVAVCVSGMEVASSRLTRKQRRAEMGSTTSSR